ncbi:hypothetical protein OR1_02198 [Geobacter sp. OR-1]|uniref:hypothetical protein n=1 Tax=Geobacter sp. OR-1 TaxID=1266765 RepID=UPI000542F94A|nr:hypothetical protein [Geobacter sp. OR-1]GAM09916.1 hypothetical protein OR1_02198 [Geobacter sp. OR-1]
MSLSRLYKLRRINSFAIAWFMWLWIFRAIGSLAAEAPAAPLPPAQTTPESSQEKTIAQTVEETHDQIERDILEQVIRFDKFFGKIEAESDRKTEYHLRWRNSLRLDNSGHINYGTNLRASLGLSRISDRLRLVIAGEDEPQPLSPNIPQDPGSPGYDRTLTPSTRIVNTELRIGLFKTSSMNMFLGGGFRIAIPFELFVRSRFQYTHPLDDLSLVRFAETLFVNNSSGFGETSEIGLERLLPWEFLLRWANSGTVSEKIPGLEWGTELSLLRELSPKSAVTVGGGIYGNSAASPVLANYRVFTCYRRNILVNWLYYELEPEIFWPRGSSGAFVSNYAVTFRLEVVFRGSAKGK